MPAKALRVLGMQGTEELDVRLCFADIRQTDGNFHASIAKNTSHRFGMECIDPEDGDLWARACQSGLRYYFATKLC